MNIQADVRNLSKWLNEEQLCDIDRQALARVLAFVQNVEPVAWGLFAKTEDGEFVLQYPVRFTKEDAEADRSMYEASTVIDIRPLVSQNI